MSSQSTSIHEVVVAEVTGVVGTSYHLVSGEKNDR